MYAAGCVLGAVQPQKGHECRTALPEAAVGSPCCHSARHIAAAEAEVGAENDDAFTGLGWADLAQTRA